ncbi:ComF family protein [Candidatus Deianiraea vastatrix]|uniref:ComF competence/DNA utilization family protein n=1 Tax=Candidatus Deianiraea vastatrix TaxID=2163644 RepID=A0A5B8XG02_9RICK|nr:ComF family protein [Candidatus Deianiraea vastatrix]QED23805.1 ComF competence/DNA utilization family protein [Candidatus Deianiraea vastatrix]
MNIFYKFLKNILNILFFNTCKVCKKHLSEGFLCQDCWKDIDFIENPICIKCGIPYKFEINKDALCQQCLSNPKIYYDIARSVCVYAENTKKMILDLKYGDNLSIAKNIAFMINIKFSNIIEKCDIITGIPSDKETLRKRKFNHSCLIAKHISKLTKVNYNPIVLAKIKKTRKQSSLNVEERVTNLKNCFSVLDKDLVSKIKKIVIIDDVFTTGTTFNEVSKVLKKYNSNIEIVCISFSRALKFNDK